MSILVYTRLYKGFQTVVPSEIRKELDLSMDDLLDWSIEDGKMIIEIKRQRPISDLSKFVIKDTETSDAVELKKKAGRGEL